MKRANNLIPVIADPDNLRLAFVKARKGKRYTRQVLDFQDRLDENLLVLREQLQSGLVDVGNYRYFKIYDPKEREICACAFPEQVLHHALMNVGHDHFERKQIYDSYACRLGKGTYAALDRAKKYTRKYRWYLKLDVQKFFANVHHGVLKAQLSGMFKDRRLLEILGKIIDSYEDLEERGLPIGNLTSQYFANHYLSGLDHFVKERLRVKAYVRYMDDMVFWADDKQTLKAVLQEVEGYIRDQLRCELKPPILNQIKYGVTFLGYRVFPYHMHLSQRSKQRFIKKINQLNHQYETGTWNEAECQRKVLPLLAFTQHANTLAFRKKVLGIIKYRSIIEGR